MPGAAAQTGTGAGAPGLPGASGNANGNVTTSTVPQPASTVTTTAATAAPPTIAPSTAVPPIPVVPTTVPGTTIPAPTSPATITTAPGPPAVTIPAPSLNTGQVAQVLRDQQRSGASSTTALVEALRPLQNLGMTQQEALTLGMGQFPMLGVANWTDDWLYPRSGPPPHQHQGTDLFSAFDTPVRAPVDGVVRFEDSGLGGKGAFVTAPDGTYYYLAHLKSFSADVRSGAAVKQGQVIGFNGDSGNAQGGAPHVHFEVHPKGGAAVNPKPFLDAWVAAAVAKVPALIASFQPKVEGSVAAPEGGVPPILVTTGLTRRFSTPSLPVLSRNLPAADFNHAVLAPLTPPALASLFDLPTGPLRSPA